MKLLSHVQLLGTPWTTAYQAPPPMGFSRQEYWSGVPLPSPNDLEYFLNLAFVTTSLINVYYFSRSRAFLGEGNGNPLQCSCLENHRDGWAAVSGVAQSRTQLKRLSSSSVFMSMLFFLSSHSLLPPLCPQIHSSSRKKDSDKLEFCCCC